MPGIGRMRFGRRPAVLVAALVLVVTAGGCQHGKSGSDQQGTAAAAHVTLGHPPAGSLGALDWTAPVLQADGSITVFADVDATPKICIIDGLPQLTTAVNETDQAVTVTVWAAPPPPSATPHPRRTGGCPTVGRAPVPISTGPLHQPLGSRSLVDASTGHKHPVLTASTIPTPGFVPAGYGQPVLSWDETSPELVTRSYTGPNGQSLLIEQRPLPDQPLYNERVLAHGTVLGKPARVAQTGNFSDNVCAIWADAHHVWWVCSQGQPAAALSPAVLLQVGNSLH